MVSSLEAPPRPPQLNLWSYPFSNSSSVSVYLNFPFQIYFHLQIDIQDDICQWRQRRVHKGKYAKKLRFSPTWKKPTKAKMKVLYSPYQHETWLSSKSSTIFHNHDLLLTTHIFPRRPIFLSVRSYQMYIP